MNSTKWWVKAFRILGIILLLGGAIDPLEGSVLIVSGGALLAVAARLERNRRAKLIYCALALLVLGVGAMLALSRLGGVGGSTGRSMWWALVVLPYPAGWILMLAALLLTLRDRRTSTLKPKA